MRSTRKRLAEANRVEEVRRAIGAIGVAASWDLDLNRLYQRVAQDLRSIVPFDRLTITSALSTGRMKVEFVHGAPEEGFGVGDVLPERPEEPDGLRTEFRSRYLSKLTATIPAANGTLTIRAREVNRYGKDELDLLRQVVAQISPGIANAIHFEASERRVKERTVLADIGHAATSARDTREIVKTVDSSLRELMDYDHLGVVLVEESGGHAANGWIAYWSNSDLCSWNVGDSVVLDLQDWSGQEVIRGAENGPLQLGNCVLSKHRSGSRTWLQVPMMAQEQFVGVLLFSSDQPDALGQEESALLLNVSLQIAPTIRNASLSASLKREADERQAVAAIGLAANEELRLGAIYSSVADELAKILPYDRLSVTHYLPEDQQREIAFVRGIELDGFRVGDRAPAPGTSEPGPIVDNADWSSAGYDGHPFERTGQASEPVNRPARYAPRTYSAP